MEVFNSVEREIRTFQSQLNIFTRDWGQASTSDKVDLVLSAAGPIVRIGKTSMNQLNKLVQRGKTPNSIIRFGKGKIKGELDHVHFSDGSALNVNGVWKHGGRALDNAEKEFLQNNGWTLPK